MSFTLYGEIFKNNEDFNKRAAEVRKNILAIFGGKANAKKIFKESARVHNMNSYQVTFWYKVQNGKKSFVVKKSRFIDAWGGLGKPEGPLYDLHFHDEWNFPTAIGGKKGVGDVYFNALTIENLLHTISAVTGYDLSILRKDI